MLIAVERNMNQGGGGLSTIEKKWGKHEARPFVNTFADALVKGWPLLPPLLIFFICEHILNIFFALFIFL